jgi:hypothetical protein
MVIIVKFQINRLDQDISGAGKDQVGSAPASAPFLGRQGFWGRNPSIQLLFEIEGSGDVLDQAQLYFEQLGNLVVGHALIQFPFDEIGDASIKALFLNRLQKFRCEKWHVVLLDVIRCGIRIQVVSKVPHVVLMERID